MQIHIYFLNEKIQKYLTEIFLRRHRGTSRLKYKRLKKQLSRRKNKTYPKRSKNHAEIRDTLEDPKISLEFGQTADKYGKFYIGSVVKEEHAFHLFASPSVINLIENHMINQPRHYLIDGTFSVVPKEFAQLLVISIEYKNDVRILSLNFPIFIRFDILSIL